MPQKCAERKLEPELVHEARDERELLGRADRAADAHGIVRGALLPRGDVFERFGEIEILERVVEDDPEAGAGELLDIARREAGDFVDEVLFEGGVVPPIGGDGAEFARHEKCGS